jgi:hypothetical protein
MSQINASLARRKAPSVWGIRVRRKRERVEEDIEEARTDFESSEVSDQKPEEAPAEQVPDDT